MRDLLAAWLTHRLLPLHLALVAIVLVLPALWVGWQMDDHYQRVVMTTDSPLVEISPIEIFSVFNGDPEVIDQYRDLGTIPWWTVENFRLAFVRHLTIFTHWLDYRLWPDSAPLMHAHSLLWFGALVAVAAVLYRRVMGATWVAGLAGLLYAIDDAHAFPAAWLANRNALLATCFGLLCLVAHDRWRRDGSGTAAVLSPIFFMLGLASGEAAAAVMAYLIAYAVFLEREGWRERVRSLVPAGTVFVAWAVLYRVLGFGSFGSGMYVDPASSPGAFGGAFLERAPFFLMGQWSLFPADLGTFLQDEAADLFWWIALVLIGFLILLTVPLIRRDRTARFWCLGMLVSLVPISATYPSDRLLFFVGLGAMGLLASFLAGFFAGADWRPSSPIWGIPAWAFVVLFCLVHLVLAPVAMPLRAWAVRDLGEPTDTAVASVPSDPVIAEQDLILVNAPDYLLYVTRIPTLKFLEGKPLPRRQRALATGPATVHLTREDERTLRLRIEGGLLQGVLGRLFRGGEHPMAVGDSVRLTGFTAEVAVVTSDGQPEEVVYRFSVPLEDRSLRWLRWEGNRYVPFIPPEVGATVILQPPRGVLESWQNSPSGPDPEI